MKDFLKKNFILVLAFSLPVLLIVVIALISYLPSLFISTNYNFVYSVCTDGTSYYSYNRCDTYLQKRYSVVESKLVVNEVSDSLDTNNNGVADEKDNFTARLFLHDTKENTTKEVTLAEAETYGLSELLTSPDGVTVSSQYSRGGDFLFVFDGGSSFGYYLMKGGAKSKLNLINSENHYYYRENFQFIGWVLPGRN